MVPSSFLLDRIFCKSFIIRFRYLYPIPDRFRYYEPRLHAFVVVVFKESRLVCFDDYAGYMLT